MTHNLLELIENNSIILHTNLNEYMTVLDSCILEEFTEQWKYNRNLNLDKVADIKKFVKNRIILDTTIHMVYDTKRNKLVVFDGNHRREALILLHKTHGINIKVCCYVYIIENVNTENVNNTDVDKFIVEKFKLINQMTPIPDIYYDILENLVNDKINDKINDNKNLKNDELKSLIDKKNIIETIYKKYKFAYKDFYSKNSKANRPNYTDTTFKDLCNTFVFNNEEELIEHLQQLNLKKKLTLSKVSQNIRNKCNAHNFYLFI
jgi:hypothetical protein